MKSETHIMPDLSAAVDQSVLAAMRIETPGLITVLETLIRIGENDETILARCRENSPTAETMRNITHALAALRKKDRPELTFDGWGINGPDEYRTRIATFPDAEMARKYGPMFAAAPQMLDVLNEALLLYEYPNAGSRVRWAQNARAAIAAATKGSP